ncbi:MAG: GNAT family N-acetyltransferase [Pikeienuella sp.]
MSYPDVIETDRLTLRRPRASDAGPIALYAGDLRVARMTTSIPHPYPPGAAEAFVQRTLKDKSREHAWVMDATKIDGAEFVGVISLIAREEGAEIGYWVGPPFWNTGYASEAAQAVVSLAAVGPLTARVSVDNEAAAHVLANAGFAEVGRSEAFCVALNQMAPVITFRRP